VEWNLITALKKGGLWAELRNAGRKGGERVLEEGRRGGSDKVGISKNSLSDKKRGENHFGRTLLGGEASRESREAFF